MTTDKPTNNNEAAEALALAKRVRAVDAGVRAFFLQERGKPDRGELNAWIHEMSTMKHDIVFQEEPKKGFAGMLRGYCEACFGLLRIAYHSADDYEPDILHNPCHMALADARQYLERLADFLEGFAAWRKMKGKGGAA